MTLPRTDLNYVIACAVLYYHREKGMKLEAATRQVETDATRAAVRDRRDWRAGVHPLLVGLGAQERAQVIAAMPDGPPDLGRISQSRAEKAYLLFFGPKARAKRH